MDRNNVKYLITFTEGTIYKYDHEDFNYVMSVNTGNFSICDCLPCTRDGQPINGYESPIPVRDIDLGDIVN